MAPLIAPPESVDAVANYLLRRAEASGCGDVSVMKLQKLAYYAQGWHLALHDGQPLFGERIEAWRFGPVVPALYHEFKVYGNDPIPTPAVELDPDTLDPVEPTLSGDEQHRDVLDQVWDRYGGFTAIQLSNKTHRPHTPWTQIHQRFAPEEIPRGMAIPHELMRRYFVRVLDGELRD